MTLIIRSITNLRSVPISITVFSTLSANQAPLVIAPSATLDLLSVVTEDDLIALQHYLNQLVSAGTISVFATIDTASFESGYTGGGGSVNAGTQNQLAYYASTGTAVSGLAAITAHSAVASNASGLPVASSTTDTELGYVHGVTSAIQTQLNGKVTSVSGTVGDISSTGGTTPVLDLVNTAVTPGSYTSTNLTVDSKGRITAAASGSSGATPNVVQFTDGADTATTSSAYVPTPTSVTITSSAGKKILIMVSGVIRSQNGSASGVNVYLFKDGTGLPGFRSSYGARDTVGSDIQNPCAFNYLDTATDSSPHTYTVYIANDDSVTTVHWYGPAGEGVIIAQEVH
jgi:hypothetical protein